MRDFTRAPGERFTREATGGVSVGRGHDWKGLEVGHSP